MDSYCMRAMQQQTDTKPVIATTLLGSPPSARGQFGVGPPDYHEMSPLLEALNTVLQQ